MYIEKLSCINFKNHPEKKLSFGPNINFLVGKNGIGKTNILDAIHYLSTSKSVFNNLDSSNITHGNNDFLLEGIFQKGSEENTVTCFYSNEKGKVLSKNKNKYKRIKEHIGNFPTIFLDPEDIDSIRFGAETRRKIFDSIICQINKNYLNDLIEYNNYLKQRNATLKKFAETRKIDKTLISIFDEKLFSLNNQIFLVREAFINDFKPFFLERYKQIAKNDEIPDISYSSHLNEKKFYESFKQSFNKDLALGYTSMGSHKDDFIFNLSSFSLKQNGSQGQKKSFIIALKLAQRDFVFNTVKIVPILLFDDIFDSLDEERIINLIDAINNSINGQIFISTTYLIPHILNYLNKNKDRGINILEV